MEKKNNCCGGAAAILVALTAVLAFGCAAGHDTFDDWIHAEDPALWEQSSSYAWRNPSAIPAEESAMFDALVDESGPEEYVRIALERNPSIRAAQQNVAAMANRIPQVTSLSDPMLEVAPIGDMAETAAGSVAVMTGVSQRFPLGGKLAAAGDVAEADVAAARAELNQQRLAVIGDVQRAYWDYYQSVRVLEIITESRASLDQLAQAADSKYRTGAASQQDVLRASVELGELDATIATLEQQSATARAMLNQLMDRPVDAGLPKPANAQLKDTSLALDALLQEAMATNPGLQKLSANIDADQQRVRLARMQRIPDLNVSFSYNLVDDEGLSPVSNGDDQWWVGFGINLPIWQDRLEAAEREARLNVLRGVSELAAERNMVALRMQNSILAAQTAHRRATLFHDVILPQARQAVDASLSGYRAGAVDFLTVTDNWRRSLEFDQMYHENIAQLNQALATLEEIIGIERTTDSGVAP